MGIYGSYGDGSLQGTDASPSNLSPLISETADKSGCPGPPPHSQKWPHNFRLLIQHLGGPPTHRV